MERAAVLGPPLVSSPRVGSGAGRGGALILFKERPMSWTYLILAGLCEIGWPIGLKLAQGADQRVSGIVIAIVAITLSGALLWLAQKEISLGTAYAVWTGIGAAGTFLVGIWFFGDAASVGRYLGATLVIAGVITLKLAH